MSRITVLILLVLSFGSVPAQAAETEDVQARIFSYFLKRASEGDMNSQFIIGSRYENGTGVTQDKDKGYEWYEKAAAQGHPIAMQKVENRVSNMAGAEKAREDAEQQAKEARAREQQAAKAREQAAQAAKAREQAAQAAKAREQAAAATAAATRAAVVKAPEPVVVARATAPRESADKQINVKDILLKGNWNYNQKPAEYLPSAKTTCLESGDNEIVCFSEELNRTVAGSYLTYTVKSTLTNFSNDGAFSATYLYNVTNIARAREPAPATGKDGPSDLSESMGWQEPGRNVSCKANDEKSLTCIKDKKYALQFSN